MKYKYIEQKFSDIEQGIALAEKFEKILDCDSEEKIHKFLFKNTIFLNYFGHSDNILFSKFRLADDYIPDFVLLGEERRSNALQASVTMIEIERSNKPLFTKAGGSDGIFNTCY